MFSGASVRRSILEIIREWRRFLQKGQGPAVKKTVRDGLDQFIRGFVQGNASTEQDFVSLGRTLRQLYASATDLTTLVQKRAAALRTALENSRLTGENSLTAQMLADVRATLGESSSLLNTLTDVGSALNELQTGAHSIKRIGVYLNSSVVSFAIESCRTPECQHAFSSFVNELRTLAATISSLADEIGRELGQTRESQAQTVQKLSAGLQGIHQLSQEIDAAARTTADEAQKLLDRSLAALHEAEDCARKIAQHADDAVYHLQFGDIVRQKAEHIASALQEAVGLLSTDTPSSEKAAASERVLAIQEGQLESVRDEILAAHCKLTSCFQRIAAETHRLAEVLKAGQEPVAGNDNARNTLEDFAIQTRRMEELQQEGRRLGDQAQATAAQAAAASSQVARHFDRVSVINFELHLQALNAIVKTSALGEQGATLEVLSSQVDRLYRESSVEVGGIRRILERVQPQSQQFLSGRSDARSNSETGEGRSEVRLGLEAIGTAYRELSETAAQAEHLAVEEETWLKENRRHLDFLCSLAEAISEQIRELGTLRAELAPCAAGSSVPAAAATLEALDQHYTMQSEREIHARVSGIEPTGASAPQETSPDTNVDLFDPAQLPEEPPALCGAIASLAVQPERASEGDQKRQAQPEPVKATDDRLGDNIELF